MKAKQIKKHIDKIVTYRTIWDTFETAKLINVKDYYAIFEKHNDKIYIKTFNIIQIEEVT